MPGVSSWLGADATPETRRSREKTRPMSRGRGVQMPVFSTKKTRFPARAHWAAKAWWRCQAAFQSRLARMTTSWI